MHQGGIGGDHHPGFAFARNPAAPQVGVRTQDSHRFAYCVAHVDRRPLARHIGLRRVQQSLIQPDDTHDRPTQARQVFAALAALFHQIDIRQQHRQHVVGVVRDRSRGQPRENAPFVHHQRLFAPQELARIKLQAPHGPARAREDQQGGDRHIEHALDGLEAAQFLDAVGGAGGKIAGQDDVAARQQDVHAGQDGGIAGAFHGPASGWEWLIRTRPPGQGRQTAGDGFWTAGESRF